MDELRKNGLWWLFKAMLCVVPVSGVLAGASAVSGFALAAMILGWIFTASFCIVICLIVWATTDDA